MTQPPQMPSNLTRHIIYGMVGGFILGTLFHYLPENSKTNLSFVEPVLQMGGQLFLNGLRMLVIPIVFVSLVCGVTRLSDASKLGRLSLKTLGFYFFTTAIAITLAILMANLLGVGQYHEFDIADDILTLPHAPQLSVYETIATLVPSNPIAALANGDMLPIIIFSILLGSAMILVKKQADLVIRFFNQFNTIMMKLFTLVMHLAPYGVFSLITSTFLQEGLDVIGSLALYAFAIIVTLALHVVITNSLLLYFVAGLSPLVFFRKMYASMLFAFSMSSSNASIPVLLNTTERKLGVHESIASFTIPLGATINMDGTAIMQAIATIFIASIFNIDLSFMGYLIILFTALLASIGTAGIPSAGLITLAVVLNQLGIPLEGIALILGVDRLLDMLRTAVNVTGDAAITCVVAKSEQALDEKVYKQ